MAAMRSAEVRKKPGPFMRNTRSHSFFIFQPLSRRTSARSARAICASALATCAPPLVAPRLRDGRRPGALPA